MKNSLFVIYFDTYDQTYIWEERNITEFVQEVYEWREWGRASAPTIKLMCSSRFVLSKLVSFMNQKIDNGQAYNFDENYTEIESYELDLSVARTKVIQLNSQRREWLWERKMDVEARA